MLIVPKLCGSSMGLGESLAIGWGVVRRRCLAGHHLTPARDHKGEIFVLVATLICIARKAGAGQPHVEWHIAPIAPFGALLMTACAMGRGTAEQVP